MRTVLLMNVTSSSVSVCLTSVDLALSAAAGVADAGFADFAPLADAADDLPAFAAAFLLVGCWGAAAAATDAGSPGQEQLSLVCDCACSHHSLQVLSY